MKLSEGERLGKLPKYRTQAEQGQERIPYEKAKRRRQLVVVISRWSASLLETEKQ